MDAISSLAPSVDARPGRSEALCTRFRALTGFEIAWADLEGLPAAFLDRPTFSPETILASLPITERTRNTLRRYLAESPATAGAWTFRRLTTDVPRFGFGALLDLLEAAQGPAATLMFEPSRERRTEVERSAGTEDAMASHEQAALAIVAAKLPVTERELAIRFARAGLPPRAVDLRRLERAVRRLDAAAPFAVFRFRGAALAVAPDDLGFAERVAKTAVRAAGQWGPLQLDGFVESLGAAPAQRSLATAVLTALPGFRWLDRAAGWFWIGDDRARIVSLVVEICQSDEQVTVDQLAAAVASRSTLGFVPPASVFAALCAQLATVEVAGKFVRVVGSSRRSIAAHAPSRPRPQRPVATLAPAL
jgi:hypothetical protein